MLSLTEHVHVHVQDGRFFQLHCSLIDQTVPSSIREDTVLASAKTKEVNGKNIDFPNVVLV